MGSLTGMVLIMWDQNKPSTLIKAFSFRVTSADPRAKLCHERIRPANTYRCTLRYIHVMMTPRVSPREDMNPCTPAGFDEASIKFQRTSKRSINQNQWPAFGGARGSVMTEC